MFETSEESQQRTSETVSGEAFSDRSGSGSGVCNCSRSDEQLPYPCKTRKNYRRTHLSEQSKQICLNVYRNLLKRKLAENKYALNTGNIAVREAAFLTAIPRSTMFKFVREGVTKRRKRSDRGKSKLTLIGESIKSIINDMCEKNEVPTISTVLRELSGEKYNISCCRETVSRWIKLLKYP